MSTIDTDGYFRPSRRSRSDRKHGAKVGSPGGVFSNLLAKPDTVEGQGEYGYDVDSSADVESLLDTVHEVGGELKRDPRRETLLRYRQAVSQLLGYIVAHGVGVEEHVSGRNILKRKKFSLVAVVDEKLNRLGAGVLQSQQDQLEILRKVDEIYGLLVDLLR